jgi:hypothetical protein
MEPCKLVSVCQRSGVDLSYDGRLHSGVDRPDRFKDDSRKDRGAVRHCFLCIDVALSCSGVGMSHTWLSGRCVVPIILQSRDLGML